MRRLEARIPPPLVALVCGAAAWGLARWSPAPVVEMPFRAALAATLVAAGVAVAFAGVLRFRRAATTVDPLHPDRASALVTAGIYRHTRNPMYLGMALVLVGWAAWLAHPLGLAGPAAFAAWISRFQIVPEERALAARFGAEFERYRAQVRRWL